MNITMTRIGGRIVSHDELPTRRCPRCGAEMQRCAWIYSDATARSEYWQCTDLHCQYLVARGYYWDATSG